MNENIKICLREEFRFIIDGVMFYGDRLYDFQSKIPPILGGTLILPRIDPTSSGIFRDKNRPSRFIVENLEIDTIKGVYICSGSGKEWIFNGDSTLKRLTKDGRKLDIEQLYKDAANPDDFACIDKQKALQILLNWKRLGWRIEITSANCHEDFKEYHLPILLKPKP